MRYTARFSFPARHEPNPWRIFDIDENTFTWHAGDVARYPNETEARQAADALNARVAAADPAVRLARLERANSRTTFVQAAIAFVLVPIALWIAFDVSQSFGGGVSHIAHLVDRLPF